MLDKGILEVLFPGQEDAGPILEGRIVQAIMKEH